MESAMKIGDVVQVLDDNLEGVIVRFQSDNSIVIETKDGFELIYSQKEVIKIASDAPKINFEGNLSKVLAEKEIPKKPGSVLTKLSKTFSLRYSIIH